MKIQALEPHKVQVPPAKPPKHPVTFYWVLGYFSQPFERIPDMIHYYTLHKLPIKGAEHMCLGNPLEM